MHCAGVPAIAHTFSSTASVTARAAAFRPPCSIASAIGRISSNERPAHSRSVSAEPRMFCTLLARYMAAISLAPSWADFGSSPTLPTITVPKSSFEESFPSWWAPCSFLFTTGERRFADLNAFPHHGCRTHLFSLFALADLFHENLRSAQPEEKTVFTRSFLKDASLHGDLHGVTRVRRNDAPADGDFLGFASDDGGDCR